MFELTAKEKAEVVANCDHLQTLKFSPGLPTAFTEHGAIMVASVRKRGQVGQMDRQMGTDTTYTSFMWA
jgi:hypothetical protein